MAAADKMNLNLGDLAAWVTYVSGVTDKTKTAYICELIEKDKQAAPAEIKEGYEAFIAARVASA